MVLAFLRWPTPEVHPLLEAAVHQRQLRVEWLQREASRQLADLRLQAVPRVQEVVQLAEWLLPEAHQPEADQIQSVAPAEFARSPQVHVLLVIVPTAVLGTI